MTDEKKPKGSNFEDADVTLDPETGEIKAKPFLKGLVNDQDALNPQLGNGQVRGSHRVNANEQTDVELGALADPGGMDPAMDRQFLKNMKERINKASK